MNARLYDPVHGRFLAPDPYISDPFDSRDYNRYGYALNNPLAYSDPNGEFLVSFLAAWVGTKIAAVITGAIIGAAVGAASYTVSVALSDGGFKNWNAGQSHNYPFFQIVFGFEGINSRKQWSGPQTYSPQTHPMPGDSRFW